MTSDNFSTECTDWQDVSSDGLSPSDWRTPSATAFNDNEPGQDLEESADPLKALVRRRILSTIPSCNVEKLLQIHAILFDEVLGEPDDEEFRYRSRALHSRLFASAQMEEEVEVHEDEVAFVSKSIWLPKLRHDDDDEE